LVNDAYAHVRTFRERMGAAGVHPDAITGVAGIERIPLTDRQAFVSTNRSDYLRADTDPALCRRA
jgi:phenylacetate-coenzyme A ligase PaaK-like adenylate-forming protein